MILFQGLVERTENESHICIHLRYKKRIQSKVAKNERRNQANEKQSIIYYQENGESSKWTKTKDANQIKRNKEPLLNHFALLSELI